MKKPWSIGLILSGACALAGLLALLWWSLAPSPAAPGSVKALALKAAAGDPSAISALKNLGADAVPGLVELLSFQEPIWRRWAWALAPRLPKRIGGPLLARVGSLNAASVRVAGVKGLAVLGPQAAPAVPSLLSVLHDREPYIGMQAASALGRIGARSIPALAKALADKSPDVRKAAAFGLGEAGASAESAIPQLTKSLEDLDPQVRASSAYSLSLIAYPVIAALSNIITHGDAAVRQSAVQQLTQFYNSLCSITPIAGKMAHENDGDSRSVAMEIFGFIRVARNGTIRTLNDALRDPSALVRECAARDLGAIGPAAGTAVENLRLCLQDTEPNVREAARVAIEQIKPKEHPANQGPAIK